MLRLRCSTLAFTLAAFLATAGSAAASSITISSGFLTVTGVQDVFTRGFLRAVGFDFFTDAFHMSGLESDGPPQNVLTPSLNGTWAWTPSGGSTEMVVLRSAFSVAATPGLAPSPFLLSGQLSVFDRLTGATLFSDTLAGSGTATWQFVTTPTGGSVVSGVRYQFDPVPVPEDGTTVLLLGIGLAALTVYRRHA
jgi:hypothetical protein